jgi:hypothetical protein
MGCDRMLMNNEMRDAEESILLEELRKTMPEKLARSGNSHPR